MCGFSGQCDLVIKDECNINRNSYVWAMRYNFKKASQLIGTNKDTKKVNFMVKDMEVFKVIS